MSKYQVESGLTYLLKCKLFMLVPPHFEIVIYHSVLIWQWHWIGIVTFQIYFDLVEKVNNFVNNRLSTFFIRTRSSFLLKI